MPNYRYKAISSGDGSVLQGVLDAPSREVAIGTLQDAGHLPVSAVETNTGRSFDVGRFPQRLRRNDATRKEITLVTRELATLVEAGLPLDQALRNLGRLHLKRPAQRLLHSLSDSLQAGLSLSDALAKHPGTFNSLYVNMIRAGEFSGSLGDVISRLADYLERIDSLRAHVLTSLIYPAVLFGFSVLSLIILMTFVIPEFIPLFDNAGQTLPRLTRAVFAISQQFQQYWWGLPAALLLILLVLEKCLQYTACRRFIDAGCLRLPWLGEVVRQVEVARFAHSLGTAIGNGVPLLTGVRLVKEVIGNVRIAEDIEAVTVSLEQGRSMAGPLKDSPVWPELAAQLVEVGETSGQLEAMLAKIADIYEREAQTAIKRFLVILEPALILGLGGLIAVIIASVLLALLSLNALVI